MTNSADPDQLASLEYCLNTKGKHGKVKDRNKIKDRNKMIDYQQICNDNHFCGIYRSIN